MKHLFLSLLITTLLLPGLHADDATALAELGTRMQPDGLRVSKDDAGNVTGLRVYKTRRNEELAVRKIVLDHFPNLEELTISSDDDGAWIDQLASKPKLHSLQIGGKVGDAMLAKIDALPALKHLDVQTSYTTDEGWEQLGKATQLESLSIRVRRPHLGDDFFDHLRGLESLKVFSVRQMIIHDPTSLVEFVKAHPGLQTLDLNEVESQHDLVGAIQAARPDLEVTQSRMRYITRIKWFDWPYGK